MISSAHSHTARIVIEHNVSLSLSLSLSLSFSLSLYPPMTSSTYKQGFGSGGKGHVYMPNDKV